MSVNKRNPSTKEARAIYQQKERIYSDLIRAESNPSRLSELRGKLRNVRRTLAILDNVGKPYFSEGRKNVI